jgi:hypothetical protein
MHRRPAAARLLAFAALALLAACEDAPSAPTSYVQVVAGGTWVAVAEPAGMAKPDSWLPYAAEGGPAWTSLQQLRGAAGRARGAGDIDLALQLDDEALRLSSFSLARAPEVERVLLPLAALDAWTDRARARLESGSYPELAATAATVRAEAEAARASLAAGDTMKAVVHVTRGTLAARRLSPMAVGLRLMASVEARLGDGAGESAGVRRARHLLRDAREGLATGDSVRALRRALYALQLLEAEGIPAAPAATTVDPGTRLR